MACGEARSEKVANVSSLSVEVFSAIDVHRTNHGDKLWAVRVASAMNHSHPLVNSGGYLPCLPNVITSICELAFV